MNRQKLLAYGKGIMVITSIGQNHLESQEKRVDLALMVVLLNLYIA